MTHREQTRLRLFFVGCFLIAGISLMVFASTDQLFGVLPPAEGQAFSIPLESGKTYTQPVHVSRSTLSQIGLHFRPLARSLPAEHINIAFVRGNDIVAHSTVAAGFINTGGATRVSPKPALSTTPGEYISVEVSVPPALSHKVGLQLHLPDSPDELHDAQAVRVRVNGEAQDKPAAYEAYYVSRPAFPLQVGALFILLGILTLARTLMRAHKNVLVALYAVGSAAAFLIPAVQHGYRSIAVPLFIVTVVIFLGMYWILRKAGVSTIASAFGANILAFTTYFPLHFLARGEPMLLLPLRDIFLDTNQILPSHAAGSYVGFPVFLLFIIGTGVIIYRRKKSDLATVVIGLVGLFVSYVVSAHAIILVTVIVAYISAMGLDYLHRYLGKHSVLATGIVVALAVVSLLDMWHVVAESISYHTLL